MTRHLVFIDNLFHLWVLLDTALEEVKGGVVSVEQRVLDVLLHRNAELAASVRHTNLELCITEAFDQSLKTYEADLDVTITFLFNVMRRILIFV